MVTFKLRIWFTKDNSPCVNCIQKPSGTEAVQLGTVIAVMVEEGEDWQNVEIPADDTITSAPEPPPETAAAPSAPTPTPSRPDTWVNTLRPRQNGRHFADDTFKRIFLNENVLISIKISLKFVPKDPINNIPALVQIMAWRRPGDKPLSEPRMVSLPTHICVTRPQRVNPNAVNCWTNIK